MLYEVITELASLAKARLELDPEQSLILAFEALSTAYTVEAENVLHQAILSSRVRQRFDSGERGATIDRVTISPDGAFIAAIIGSPAPDGSDFLVVVWSTDTGQHLFQVPISYNFV